MEHGAAQRRPESELRRHDPWSPDPPRAPWPLNEGRSLNSGDTSTALSRSILTIGAQRRPESELRRHSRCSTCSPIRSGALNEGRSLNSGDTCRGRSRATAGAALNEGRSLNSGDTPGRRRCRRRAAWTLNEGRSLNSGDTTVQTGGFGEIEPAQRRPESELRRHGADHDTGRALR